MHFLARCCLPLAVAVSIAAGQSQPGRPATAAPATPVILITIDTLRADRLGCYGNASIRTPNLDRLARDGARFAQAIVDCPITLPSHCSILTGTYPVYHGVRDNSGYRLPQQQITLAEVFKKQGYRTGAFLGAAVLDSVTGLDQGFDVYADDFQSAGLPEADFSSGQRRGGAVMDRALAWMQRARPGEKSFVWIHLFDPHAPYDPPAPFAARYRADPYDGEVAYVDSVVGRLISYLVSSGQYEQSLMAVTSDHGEGLGQHGEATHGLFLYDATLRVPWLLKAPARRWAGRIVEESVQSVDVMPTLLQILGFPRPESVQGAGQVALLEGTVPTETRFSFGETLLPRNQYGWSALFSLRTGQHKWIEAPRPELYDLKKDPEERNNLFHSQQGLALQLKQHRSALAAQYSGNRAAEARLKVSDPEAFQRLLGLGYVAVDVPAAGADSSSSGLPDPKDKIAIFDLLWSAASDSEARRYDDAVLKLKRVLATDPETYFARALLGMTYHQMGDLASAARELRAALTLRPADVVTTFYLGLTLARMGQHQAAREAFEKVLELDPANDGALNNLGIVALNEKRFDSAAALYRRLVASKPHDSFAWANLGLALMNLQKTAEAVTALEKAAEIDPAVPQIRNNLGLALMSSDRPADAIVHYRKAIALDPNYGQAHYNLALALGRLGRTVEAGREMTIARRLLKR